MTAFDQAVVLVYSYIKRKDTLDTERPDRVRQVMGATGNPHHNLKSIHVTGTKGKGSTCAMLAAALRACGYRVGLYTSPHLYSIRERIQVDGQPIPEVDFIRWAHELQPHFDRVPGIGFPEVLTCMMLHYFAAQQVDVAVIEVHLGGRYDSTNVITPLCSAITTIDYDHTDILGETLAAIAYQKAGIIKRGVPVVTAPQQPEAFAVIEAEAQAHNAPRTIAAGELAPPSREGQSVTVDGETYQTNLLGQHQGVNLAVAVTALKQLPLHVAMEQARKGLLNVAWGGRLQITRHNPTVILDIAHNVAAARVLRQTLDALFPEQARVFVYGSKANKDVRGILAALVRPHDHLILTQVQDPPTAPPQTLAEMAAGVQNIYTAPTVIQAYQHALSLAARDKLVCVTGSIFVVAAAGQLPS